VVAVSGGAGVLVIERGAPRLRRQRTRRRSDGLRRTKGVTDGGRARTSTSFAAAATVRRIISSRSASACLVWLEFPKAPSLSWCV